MNKATQRATDIARRLGETWHDESTPACIVESIADDCGAAGILDSEFDAIATEFESLLWQSFEHGRRVSHHSFA
jgi:hypothetical protein